MDPYIYNIPAALAEAYQGKRVIARSKDPAELAAGDNFKFTGRINTTA